MRHLFLYSALKTILPRAAQIRLRQLVARQRRARVTDFWPILENAGRKPEGWQGWPEGKQFAFVLTHDVESQRGLDRCRQIMDIEERLGFRSCFNFVPRRYAVTRELREEMVRRGFEVGVHGLHHDLSLFSSEAEFRRQAPAINRVAAEWGAVGFRAPYMMRNLPWIRDYLEIAYDSSTFDSDPFEPLPQGVGTVFPFIVDGGSAGRPGYVELPCTLPQDLTLFVLLGEKNTAIWKKKLEWIAQQGGLALFDTHPDYMQSGPQLACDEYPLHLYGDFLEHVRTCYAGKYWHALPREVAAYCRSHPERVRHGIPRRICMLAYAFCDTDNRILRYAETLARCGDEVETIGLRRKGQTRCEVIQGVQHLRIQHRQRNERGRFLYLLRMLRFFAHSWLVLRLRNRNYPYDLVHVHSVPDFQVFAARCVRHTGARIILDIHDLVPEFYASKFGVPNNAVFCRLLRWIERRSAGFADHVIIANHIWLERLIQRTVPASKCTAIPNYVDGNIFRPSERTRRDKRTVLIYPGGLQRHQGLDLAIRALAQVRATVPDAELHIYGEGPEESHLRRLVAELKLEGAVRIHCAVNLRAVPGLLAEADIGIVPKRADGFGNEAYSTKILEFMTQGLPVVAARTAIDQHYFDDGSVLFFESGNVEDLARAIRAVATDAPLREKLIARGRACVARNCWDGHRQEYLALVDRLAAEAAASRRRPLRACLAGPLFYDSDNRTLRYAETLRDHGFEVDVLALRSPGQPRQSIVDGIRIFRIQQRVRNEKGAYSYLVRLTAFLARSFLLITWRHARRPYDLVHTHSIPDFQVFAALVPRLTGARVILDIYDLLPEFYLSKFGADERSYVYRLLLLQERLSARFAHHVISANHLWQRKLTARAVPAERCTPFINYIDMRLFRPRTRQRHDACCRVIYPGVLNWHQGVDICIRAFQVFHEQEPQAEFHVYGDGPEKPRLAKLIADLGLADCVQLHAPVPLAEIPQLIADADIGVVGKRADVFGNEAYSTKILEYMSQGIPAVVPRTAIDAFYFPETVVAFYEPGNATDMAARMLQLWRDTAGRAQQTARALTYAQANNWKVASREYLGLVDQLLSSRGCHASRRVQS